MRLRRHLRLLRRRRGRNGYFGDTLHRLHRLASDRRAGVKSCRRAKHQRSAAGRFGREIRVRASSNGVGVAGTALEAPGRLLRNKASFSLAERLALSHGFVFN
jgi:hypothetical protein